MWIRRLDQISKQFLFSTAVRSRYYFQHGSYMIPHPDKVSKGGEDAMFTSDQILAVADGVGGWANHGIDPGLYSKRLCKLIGSLTEKEPAKYIADPRQLLIDAVGLNKEVGTTTACIATIDPDTGLIRFYYIGDSVYAIFKPESVQIAGDQQKSFNFPYQVGTDGDHPSKGVYSDQESQKMRQDIIALASDGVWDNTHLKQLHACIVQGSQLSLGERARKVAQASSYNSLQENNSVPFYEKARKAGLRMENSGKPDDITVILARIAKRDIKEEL